MSNIMDDDAIRPSVKQTEDALAKQQVIPPDQAAQEELDEILDMVTDGCVVPSYIAESKAKAKAALLDLMYRETLAVIGEDVPHEKSLIRVCATYQEDGKKCTCGKSDKLLLIAQQRQAAKERYGQIRGEE